MSKCIFSWLKISCQAVKKPGCQATLILDHLNQDMDNSDVWLFVVSEGKKEIILMLNRDLNRKLAPPPCN